MKRLFLAPAFAISLFLSLLTGCARDGARETAEDKIEEAVTPPDTTETVNDTADTQKTQ